MTFLLLIINTLVFLTTSGGDEETLVNAVEAYETEQILGIELPLFQAYLTSESDGPAWPRVTFLHIDALIAKRKLAVAALPTAVRCGMVSTITHDVVAGPRGSTC